MLNHILAALNDYVFAFDPNEGNYNFISNNIAELAGYSGDEFKNNTGLWFQLIDERDIVKVEEVYDKPIEKDNYTNINYRITTAQNQIKWVNEKRCIYINETGQPIILSIIKDIQPVHEDQYNQEESIAGYNILFNNNPGPMWIYEIATLRILKVNAAAIKTYGYTEDEFLTMTIKDLRAEDEHENLEKFMAERGITDAGNSGFSKSGIWKHLNKKGGIIYAQMYGDAIKFKNYDCRIAIANNITERVYYQEGVKLREQFLNSLSDSQTNFLIRIDNNGNYTFANKQFLKTFGYKKSELVGKRFNKTTLPQENYLCETAFYNCINNPGKVIKLVHKKPAKNGAIHDTEWEFIAITDDNGDVTGIQGIGQDITDKISTQKEIATTKASLEAIINNTEDLIWSLDRDFKYLYINQAYKSAIAMQAGLKPQKGEDSQHEIYGEETLKKWRGYYQRAFNGESFIVINENINPETGEAFSYETSFNPMYNADGKITGIGCFARDITERIKSNKAIISQNERLKNIASLSSHELRRPVATMLGLLNIFDKDDFYNPENREIINHLLNVGREIDDVIRLIVNNTFLGQSDVIN